MKFKILISALLMMSLPIIGHAGSVDGAIKYRKAVMNSVKGSADAMVQILTGGVDVENKEQALKDIAAALAQSARATTTINAFKQNTHGQGAEKTTATAKVWEDWADFSDAFTRMEAAAMKISEQANAGTLEMSGMKSVLFKECGYCHRKAGYRTKKK